MKRSTLSEENRKQFAIARQWGTVIATILLVLILPLWFAWIGFFGLEGGGGIKHQPGHGVLGAIVGFVIGVIVDGFFAAMISETS